MQSIDYQIHTYIFQVSRINSKKSYVIDYQRLSTLDSHNKLQTAPLPTAN